MSQRRPIIRIALLTLLALGAAALGRAVPTLHRASETPPHVAAPPIAPPLIVTRPGSDLRHDLTLDPPPALGELLARYPQLAMLGQKIDLSDRAQLARAYPPLVALYRAEGQAALGVFLAESGALPSLNLDPVYLDLVLAYETGGPAAAAALAARRRLLTDNGQLRAVLRLAGDDRSGLEPALTAAGATVLDHRGGAVEIAIPLAPLAAAASAEEALGRLVALAHRPPVIALRAPSVAPVEALPAFNEGVGATMATAWHAAGYTGTGVKVGIIDPEGFYGYQALLGSELPPAERVFVAPWHDPATLNATGEGHGTACAEVVHDMAPDATLYLAYSGLGGVTITQAVDWLIANGVDVITHSAASIIDPLDGNDPVDQDVARAQAAGILWVNAAGNYALSHLNMPFTDSDGDGYHEFPHGTELLPLYVADHVQLGLSWDEPWHGAGEDYDLYLYSLGPTGEPALFASSRLAQSGGAADQPFELLELQLWPFATYYAVIRQSHISRPGRLNLVGWGMEFAYSMPAGSLGSPADAGGALAVGATNWYDNVLEPYSSQGPTSDGRTKPDLTGPARVSTATFGSFDGTSAAAPHVAGAAALALSAFPNLDVLALRDFLTTRALDAGPPGPDNIFGAGRLNLQQPPVAGDPGGGVAAATVHTVRLVPEQSVGGVRGVMITVDFSVIGLSELTGTLVARFSDAAGQPLTDSNGQYTDASGGAAVGATFSSTQARTNDYSLFMPYDELGLPPGEHTVLVTVTLYDAAGNVLGAGAPVATLVRQRDNRPQALFTAPLRLRHSVAHDGAVGIDILVDFDALSLAGQTATMAAYFYYDGPDNTPLHDFNQQYCTQDGVIAVGRRFTPDAPETAFRDFALFIPYEELHLATGARYNLKLRVVIWNEATGETLGLSDWSAFWFES